MDRDGTHFHFILRFLRDPLNFEAQYLDEEVIRHLLIEADFYLIPKLVEVLKTTTPACRSTGKKVVGYNVLPTHTNDPQLLKLIQEGWELFGPTIIKAPTHGHYHCFYQTLVKYG